MSLTGQLRSPNSPVSKFFDKHMDMGLALAFVAAQNAELVQREPLVVPNADPPLVGNAFCYLFRWTVMPIKAEELVAIIGARRLHAVPLFRQIVDQGFRKPDLRPALAVLLAMFEEVSRGRDAHPILSGLLKSQVDHLIPAVSEDSVLRASIEDVALLGSTIPAAWGDDLVVRSGFKASPTFSGSQDVGGADANWLLNGTLWDSRCTRMRAPFTLLNLQQQIGYAILDYHDDLRIKALGWYYARQACRLIYPLDALINDIDDLRDKFQDEVGERGNRHEYDYGSYYPELRIPRDMGAGFYLED